MMGGFEYDIIRDASEIENLCRALEDLEQYLEVTNQWEDGWASGLIRYNLFKDENDIIWEIYPRGTKDTKKAKPERIVRVKDVYPEYVEDLKRGKQILYWVEIAWLRKIPLPIINRFREALKKHGCEWFWIELVGQSDNIANLGADIVERAFPDAKLEFVSEW